MGYYRRQPIDSASDDQFSSDPVASVGRTLRRLLPMPASSDSFLAPLASLPLAAALAPEGAKAALPLDPVQAATTVANAAAILDEEMARGVLAARDLRGLPVSRGSHPEGNLLRQLHDVLDNVARLWPDLQSALPAAMAPGRPQPAGGVDGDSLPHVKPASSVRAGERATVAMTLSNKESRSVRLTPMATDLISCDGHRLPRDLFEFVPRELALAAGEQADVKGHIAIPPNSPSGRYSGLLVVAGVEYLRALITVDVA